MYFKFSKSIVIQILQKRRNIDIFKYIMIMKIVLIFYCNWIILFYKLAILNKYIIVYIVNVRNILTHSVDRLDLGLGHIHI